MTRFPTTSHTFPVYRHEIGGMVYTSTCKYAKEVSVLGELRIAFSNIDAPWSWEKCIENMTQAELDNPPESLDAEGMPLYGCLGFLPGPGAQECRTTTTEANDPLCANCVKRIEHGWKPVFDW